MKRHTLSYDGATLREALFTASGVLRPSALAKRLGVSPQRVNDALQQGRMSVPGIAHWMAELATDQVRVMGWLEAAHVEFYALDTNLSPEVLLDPWIADGPEGRARTSYREVREYLGQGLARQGAVEVLGTDLLRWLEAHPGVHDLATVYDSVAGHASIGSFHDVIRTERVQACVQLWPHHEAMRSSQRASFALFIDGELRFGISHLGR